MGLFKFGSRSGQDDDCAILWGPGNPDMIGQSLNLSDTKELFLGGPSHLGLEILLLC